MTENFMKLENILHSRIVASLQTASNIVGVAA